MAGGDLYIDASELDGLLKDMAGKLTPGNFDKLMRRSLNEVGRRSKKPIRKAVTGQYAVKAGWVNEGIKSAKVSGGGGEVSCVIPLVGAKGHIGGTFAASGGHPGWNPPKYRIRARIVKSGLSVLPAVMSHQGGQPPFINTSAAKLNGVAFTRTGKERFPIESISALALPQMPLNRAKPETEREILELTEKRVVHNFEHMFG